MRKPLIVIMSILFTGALLVYTAQANLNLLQQVYVNPQYVAFGMLALEGGVIYWLGYYLLHWDNNHKAIALVMSGIDFLLSMIGFFMDLNLHTGDQVHTALPPVLIVMSIDVALNVGVGLLVHFLPHGAEQQQSRHSPTPNPRQRQAQPKNEESGEPERPLEHMAYAQTTTTSQPTTPFWSRMKAATEAFKATSNQQLPTRQSEANSQQTQGQTAQSQSAPQEQPISPADLERMAQLKHSDMFHLENLLGKENYQALLRRLVQGQSTQNQPEAPTQSQSD